MRLFSFRTLERDDELCYYFAKGMTAMMDSHAREGRRREKSGEAEEEGCIVHRMTGYVT